jgi:hypothetical protein
MDRRENPDQDTENSDEDRARKGKRKRIREAVSDDLCDRPSRFVGIPEIEFEEGIVNIPSVSLQERVIFAQLFVQSIDSLLGRSHTQYTSACISGHQAHQSVDDKGNDENGDQDK